MIVANIGECRKMSGCRQSRAGILLMDVAPCTGDTMVHYSADSELPGSRILCFVNRILNMILG